MPANHALRQARQERGWSQAVVAAHLETSTKNVSRWECGDTRPSPYFRAKLCQLFARDASSLGLLTHELTAPTTSMPILDPWLPRLRLPVEQFLGRQGLLDHLRSQLCQGYTCVLSGLPGVGKTTIAQVLGMDEALRAYFSSGIIWVSLGFTPDVFGQLRHCAELLGIAQEELVRKRNLQEWNTLLRHTIGSRRLLIILDDVWTVEDAQPFLIDTSQVVSYLITTRLPQIALALSDGHPIVVPELSQEQSQDLLTLLVPALTMMDAEQVQSVTNFTGGLPLAVTLVGKFLQKEGYGGQTRRLASAIARLLDPLHRLHTSVDKGSELPSDLIHNSLHAAISLSDRHLSGRAQQALRALSLLPVKPDYFLEEAALAVCEDSVEVIDTLCDAGLLESLGSGRYTLHQTIAEYARFSLHETSPAERLLRYALQRSKDQRDLKHFAEEHSTLLAALRLTASQGKVHEQITLTHYLTNFWRVQGYIMLAEQEIHKALNAARMIQDIPETIQLLCDLAQCLFLRGDTLLAEATLLEAEKLARAGSYPALLGQVLHSQGNIYYSQGNLDLAERCFRESLVLTRNHGEVQLIEKTLSNLGAIAASRGNWDEARGYWQERLMHARSTQNKEVMCRMLENLGRIALYRLGSEAEAQAYLQEALELAEELAFHLKRCDIRCMLGELAAFQGKLDLAERYNRQGLDVARQFGYKRSLILLLDQAASFAMKDRDVSQTEMLLEEAEHIAQGNSFLLGIVNCGKGNLRLMQHRLQEAQYLLEQALAAFATNEEEECARVEYALAQVYAEQEDLYKARQLGERSLTRFTLMQHREVPVVRAWLQQLRSPQHAPTSSTPLFAPEVDSLPPCPRCARQDTVSKRGKSRNGAQRYHCKQCKHDFTQNVQASGIVIAHARELAAQGISFRAIARRLGVHHKTVSRWMKESAILSTR